ncbi:MAG TPA: SgcJ/EcaC family oxidoreductase [Ktedonobacterales bacterium]|nr:SgcJ/EcaC family oxidoreductase [Ktedonobacterales bacterium]
MSSQPVPANTSGNDALIIAVFHQLLERWNQRDASGFAARFMDDGVSIGFDGSAMNGRDEIEVTLSQIFADHVTSAYIGKVRSVRLLAPDVALLLAVVGMVPPGKSDINPAVNAMYTLVMKREAGEWRIALLQNTPAQFHGRPEMAEALTQELRQLL